MIPVLPRITREAVSGASGTASLFVWIFAQTPQIYQNFRTKSVEGLSFVFLLQWTLGDLTNLVGAFLTNQLPIQMVIAAYMLLVDVTLCTQYALYYREPLPPRISPAFPTERSPLIGALYRPAHTSTTGTTAMASTSRSRHVLPSMSRQTLRARSLDPWMVYRVRPHRPSRRTRAPRKSESTDDVTSKPAASVERGRRSKAHTPWRPHPWTKTCHHPLEVVRVDERPQYGEVQLWLCWELASLSRWAHPAGLTPLLPWILWPSLTSWHTRRRRPLYLLPCAIPSCCTYPIWSSGTRRDAVGKTLRPLSASSLAASLLGSARCCI